MTKGLKSFKLYLSDERGVEQMAKVILLVAPITRTQREELTQVAPKDDFFTLSELPDDRWQDIEVIYGWSQTIDVEKLKKEGQTLRWIQAESAGFNHLPLSFLQENNIMLSNASGVHGNQMSETILGMIFSHTRGLKESIHNQRDKLWETPKGLTDLANKKVMIVGTGAIGQRLAEILTVFNVDVLGVNRRGGQAPFFKTIIQQDKIQQSLGEMDIVVSLLPSTAATKHLFNSELFEQMKEGSLFINAGRGDTVNTPDLITALEQGPLAFAGLDVFEHEPLPTDSPLWEMDNVMITPHTSGVSDQYYERLFPIFKDNLVSFKKDHLLVRNQVSIEQGY